MKKIIFSYVALSLACTAMAQSTITVVEPEFQNSYIHLTSASTFVKQPKETAQFKNYESKTSKFAKIASGVADVAGAVGVGAAWGGSASATGRGGHTNHL